MSGPGSMRNRMPQCAAFIDSLRDAFGRESVDAWIRDGIARNRFHAAEAGHVIGSPMQWGHLGGSYLPPESVRTKK